jgi:hypothetical protein
VSTPLSFDLPVPHTRADGTTYSAPIRAKGRLELGVVYITSTTYIATEEPCVLTLAQLEFVEDTLRIYAESIGLLERPITFPRVALP